MAINTNISLNKTQKQYYQRFVNLSPNETPLPQGDGTIRISPFDDYYVFTLYEDVDDEPTPIDLSNVGEIFLSFIGNNDEIAIKNHTQVEEIDQSQGEVLFKISKSDSKKVLALDNNNFYISTKMVDPVDNSISDESILYQGTFLAFDDESRVSLSKQLEDTRIEYSVELAKLKEELEALKKENADLLIETEEDENTIQTLRASNEEMANEIEELTKDLASTKKSALMLAAKNAQALANKRLKKILQIRALRERAAVAQTKSKRKSFFKQASKNLQNYTTNRNPVTNSSTIKDDFGTNRNYE